MLVAHMAPGFEEVVGGQGWRSNFSGEVKMSELPDAPSPKVVGKVIRLLGLDRHSPDFPEKEDFGSTLPYSQEIEPLSGAVVPVPTLASLPPCF